MSFSGKMDQRQSISANPWVENATAGALTRGSALLDQMPETPAYYGGTLVAGMTPEQQAALQAAYGRGMGGSATDQGLSQYIMGQLGQDYSGALGTAQGALGQMAQGGMSLQDAARFAQGGAGPYSAALQSQASGQINPLTTAMYRDAAQNLGEQFNESVLPGLNATFAQSGRTGGGLHAAALGNAAGELADAQGSLATNMYGQAAEGALGRQLSAAQSGLQSALGQQGLAAQLYGQGQNNALQAASALQGGALGGMQNQQGAAGLAGLANQLDYTNLGAAQQAADRYQGQSQAEIDAEIQRYMHNASRAGQDYQNAWQALGAYSGLTAPLQGTGSTNSAANKWSKWS